MPVPNGTQKVIYTFSNADAIVTALEANNWAIDGAGYTRQYEVLESDTSWPS